MNNMETKALQLRLEIISVVNYALQQNRIPFIREILIENISDEAIFDLRVEISCEPRLIHPFVEHIAIIPANSIISIKEPNVILDGDYLAGLTERITGTMTISAKTGEDIIVTVNEVITVLSFNEWHGPTIFPNLLTAFITPNHPEVIKIVAQAAQILGEWSGNPSLNAYQSSDHHRIRMQIAAIYGAIQSHNIIYSVPPASFETVGQRVRMCDSIMQEKMGTCLDLSLLYASCLEQIGLRPLLILQPGHILVGVWLEELSFAESIQDDLSCLSKRLADGVNEILLVESTALTAGKSIDFEAASKLATESLYEKPFDFLVDVRRARLSGIKPLPMRLSGKDGWSIIQPPRAASEITQAPSFIGAPEPISEGIVDSKDKLEQWKRKLLDLSARNTLINLRVSKSLIPILSPSLSDLEDALSDGSSYRILPHPSEWSILDEDKRDPGKMTVLGDCGGVIQAEFKHKRLRAALNERELSTSIVTLYRSAKTAMEENGANTLYLALGLLRWFDTKGVKKERYAPIILLPVEIVRKSALKGYKIRLRDEDPQMNITLLEMLRQDFGISVAGLDPLPLDDNGIDIRRIFSILRRAVMEQEGWDVVEAAFLGTFSFSQFVMWNDLCQRSDALRQNKIVRSLLDGQLSWAAEAMEINNRIDESSSLLPMHTDASQLFAINESLKEKSFILHGPPGTGKSQTITGIIVNILAQGKTVLFVAEKMAALSVVQKRLEALGLASFCMELHSNKSKKKDVLNQLREASEVTKFQSSEVYQEKVHQIAEMRHELDAYVQALHRTQACELTLYEMLNRFEENFEASDCISFSKAEISQVNIKNISHQERCLGRLIVAAQEVGHPHNHPLRYVQLETYARSLPSHALRLISDNRGALEELSSAGKKFTAHINEALPCSKDEWTGLYKLALELVQWKAIPQSWAQLEEIDVTLREVKKMADHYTSSELLRKEIELSWTVEFLRQDAAALLLQWNELSQQWFIPKYLGQRKMIKSLSLCAKNEIDKETIEKQLEFLRKYQIELQKADLLFSDYGHRLDFLCDGKRSDWDKIATLAITTMEKARKIATISGGAQIRKAFASSPECHPFIEKLISAYKIMETTQHAMYTLLAMEMNSMAEEHWLSDQMERCDAISENMNQVREWATWNRTKSECLTAGLEVLVKAYEGGLGHDALEAAWKRGLYMALIEDTIDKEDALSTFSGVIFREKIEQFREMNLELINLSKMEVFYRLASKVPNFAKEASKNSEVGILQRAIRSNGRGVSIRNLFERIPSLLPRMSPCMLMSPISAAQYLDPARELFDVVIFDEASQITTAQAVGALARGKEAVIVGDPKQMPPTNFFGAKTNNDEETEEDDLESILDDCLALNMPQTHLLWHYRSRHESLIAFCNNRFYGNKLYTFPSDNDLESKVSLVAVEGFFDRGKTRQNLGEAEAIIAELQRRCHDPACMGQSVGVVTFNVSQQNLIDDLLTEACKNDPGLENWAYQSREPIFIKNLENVQGDERDVILFSISFGPDSKGKVSLNFGPLNRNGGWRRLNVAVSRAREEMIVYSIMTPDQIDLSRTGSEGVASLKAFLEYAKNGRLTQDVSIRQMSQSDEIIKSICKKLKKEAYHTKEMVGNSGYRVDIAVVDPTQPKRYLVGILLDGSTYVSSKTTNDRELAQISVLKGLGWEIYRIWSVDWWNNSDKEMAKLLEYIKEMSDKASKQIAQAATPPALVINLPDTKLASGYQVKLECAKQRASGYRATILNQREMSSDDFTMPENSQEIGVLFETILAEEAPILESLLIRRALKNLGIGRVGARLQSRSLEILAQLALVSTGVGGQKTYWSNENRPENYWSFRESGTEEHRREAKDLPEQETANAVVYVLSEQLGQPRGDLIREVGKLLGYSRAGNVVDAAVSLGIAFALNAGRISESEDGYLSFIA